MRKTYVFFATNLPSLLLISAIAASSPFSLKNFAASLHKVMHSSLIALSAIPPATSATLARTTPANTATFLIASPFPSPVHPACSRRPFPCLHRNPVVPSDHLLESHRQVKGFIRARAQPANRFFLFEGRRRSRTASRLPICRDGAAGASRNYQSTGQD